MLLQALIAILISGSLACLLMAVLSLHHRKNPGMRIFIALLLAISIYAFTYGIELANSTLDGKLSWIRIEYLGIAPLPALWLLLAFYYINRTEWLTWPRIVLLWVIPIVVYGGVLTNPFFHLLYTSVGLDTAGPFPNLAFTRGPIYWLAIGYDFLSVIVSILLLTIQRLNPHRMYRRQVSILLVSSLVTILVVGLYLAGIQPIRDLDINPFAMLLSSLIMGWGLVRYQLIDLSPVAQNLVLRKIQIGVIILGSKNRVVEANPAALNDLGLTSSMVIGKDYLEVLANWPALVNFLQKNHEDASENIPGKTGKENRTFTVEITPFSSEDSGGYLLLLRDITIRIESETELREQQRRLATLEERERVARELHDGIGQVIGYVNTQSQAARGYLQQGQIDLTESILTRLTEVTQDAHADIRDFILGMKSGSDRDLTSRTLLPSLRQYLNTYSDRYGIPVKLSIPDPFPENLVETKNELLFLRILQEALINAGKHAHAATIQITFFLDDVWLRAIVADDGCGFDPATHPVDGQAHFGLGMMRERAAEMNGRLEVRSVHGQGTQVIIECPRPQAKEITRLSAMQVLLADDQPLFRDGLHNLLATRGIRVVGEASNGREAVELARQLRPDIILMDVNMPEMDGLEAVRLIKAEVPSASIVMLTVAEDENTLFQAIRNGASGYLHKGLKAGEFFHLLDDLARGEPAISPWASQMLKEFARNPEKPVVPSNFQLTERQMQILELSAERMTYREIAARLYLSEATVKYHVSQILDRLHVKTRLEALHKAEDEGLLPKDF